jgi:hypothetical protein
MPVTAPLLGSLTHCTPACFSATLHILLSSALVAAAGLFPAPLFGPLLGILGVYAADRGDLADVKRKLFGDKKGQFKSG